MCLADGVKFGARAIIRQATEKPGGFLFQLGKGICNAKARARQRNGPGRLEGEELFAGAMAGQRGNPIPIIMQDQMRYSVSTWVLAR